MSRSGKILAHMDLIPVSIRPFMRSAFLPKVSEDSGVLKASKFSGKPWLNKNEHWSVCQRYCLVSSVVGSAALILEQISEPNGKSSCDEHPSLVRLPFLHLPVAEWVATVPVEHNAR